MKLPIKIKVLVRDGEAGEFRRLEIVFGILRLVFDVPASRTVHLFKTVVGGGEINEEVFAFTGGTIKNPAKGRTYLHLEAGMFCPEESDGK